MNHNTIGFKYKCENPIPCSWEAILNLKSNLTNKKSLRQSYIYMYIYVQRGAYEPCEAGVQHNLQIYHNYFLNETGLKLGLACIIFALQARLEMPN